MIWPDLFLTMFCIALWEIEMSDVMFAPTIFMLSSISLSWNFSPPSAPPALLISKSIFSNSAGNVSNACAMLASSLQSNTIRWWGVSSSSDRALSLSRLRPCKISLMLWAANLWANALPKSLVAPVINTHFGVWASMLIAVFTLL